MENQNNKLRSKKNPLKASATEYGSPMVPHKKVQMLTVDISLC